MMIQQHSGVHRIVILLGFVLGLAVSAARAAVPDGAACGLAARAAEQAAALPANLLVSVGLVESGRQDLATGQMAPWPWTVNVDGAGRFFETRAEAVAFARLAQSSGAGDVDVGCFQVSLRYHPATFGSLDQAFEPATNAQAAADFLNQLKGQTGSWPAAIASYHSAAPELGLPYQRLVLAAWRGLGNVPLDFADIATDALAPDLVVVKLAPAARRVRVFTMADPAGAGLRGALPRVIWP